MEITDYIPNEPQLALAERLIEVAPPAITRVAVGLVGHARRRDRREAGARGDRRPMILTFYGQYHGETTYLTASASTDLSESPRRTRNTWPDLSLLLSVFFIPSTIIPPIFSLLYYVSNSRLLFYRSSLQ
jgi:hypothetical protein